MEKTVRREMRAIWVLKALTASYVVTGLLLLLLTLLVYKLGLDEEKVTAGIAAIYALSTFVGGIVIGKLSKMRKFLWGLTVGLLYFGLLLLISFGIYRTLQGSGTNILTSFLLCAAGGMAGGMIS
nr:TIGR04086 family membrane protein [uncultured Faecalimonas sp.]